ncbi:hypothetical protein AURDEDRAFT_124369 [Auricularia subglabra TFB-10046 SS5]|nr:hypothetical protein AURDEDRAFT_124369 [Auricularia subglabra TFB-10046 SS5]
MPLRALRVLVATWLVFPAARAGPHNVDIVVGSRGKPDLLIAPMHVRLVSGNTVSFVWRSNTSNLSVVQSEQTVPCSPKAAGFNSGFLSGNSDDADADAQTQFQLEIRNDEDPIFFYVVNGSASAAQRCVEGTYGSINASPVQLDLFNQTAVALTAFPDQSSPTASPSVPNSGTRSSSTPKKTDGGSPGRNKDEDGKDGLSTGTIAAISLVSILALGILFWFFRRRRTQQRRRVERRPTRDTVIDPPPAYVAVHVQPASISAGSQMTEVWEEVGGRTIMRAPSVASQPATSGSLSGTAPSATLDTNPFASPEDAETATLRSSSRPTSPASSDEDAPPEYMSSHSVPPPFSPVARR